MAASCCSSITNTACRRLNKKALRNRKYLKTSENIKISDAPTNILCVQNGGLGNGVSREEVLEIFCQHGSVQDVIMIPKKPYCFVYFDNSASAISAKENRTGHLLQEGKDPSQNVVLYPFFVAEAPSWVCPTTEMPPGLVLVEDFISPDAEEALLQMISFDKDLVNAGTSMKHRQVRHFGYEFNYQTNNVDPTQPLKEGIPEICNEFLKRALDRQFIVHVPDQLTVNQYLPGQGIPPHIDTPSAFEDGIMSLSCGSQVVMDFRHPDGQHISVLLLRRSLLLMTRDSRYIWSHGITPRKSDIVSLPSGGLTLVPRQTRTSFTFRKLSPTAGIIPEKNNLSFLPTTDKEAAALEKQHVHQVYEKIGAHFSDTRYKPWPQILQFLLAQEPGSVLVDFGCGNGKYFGINKSIFEIGSDRSEKLASICRDRGFQVFRADIRKIPVRDNSVDVCLCIAVIHHLSTKTRRKKAVKELVRILRPGGCVLIYVWAKEQEKDKCKSKYLKESRQPKTRCSLLKETSENKTCHPLSYRDDGELEEVNTSGASRTHVLEVHVNRTEFKSQDMLVPWHLKKPGVWIEQPEPAGLSLSTHETLHRFYHVFEQGELEKLCAEVTSCFIERSYYDQGNWCVVLKKM